jgi:hypothetical protein
VKPALAEGLESPKVRGRHFAIDEDSEAGILEWIEAQAEKSDAVTRTDPYRYYRAKYSVRISRGWLDALILRQQENLAETKSTPQEDMRLEVPRVFLNATVHHLRQYVQGMKAELVFNLDQLGVSQWEDRRDRKVVIPRTMSGQTTQHRASRNVKHMSIMKYISAAGESLTLYLMRSQES